MEVRDDNGFIDIDYLEGQGLVKKIDNNSIKISYLNIENKNYYFKQEWRQEFIYNELIAEELAKDFGIDCAHYDLANYKNKKGVISEDIFNENDKHFTLEEILSSYFGEDHISILSNLEDIWEVFSSRYKNEELVSKLMGQIVNIFMFDALIGNSDRNMENIEVIEKKDDVNIAPIFDNSNMLSDSTIQTGRYALGLDSDDFNQVVENEDDNFLYRFLNVSADIYEDIFKRKLWIISKENIEKVFNKVENRIKSSIPEYIKEFIFEQFATNEKCINKVLERLDEKKAGIKK